MHFWIDKRSQCGYSGRHRVPSSLSAGVGAGVGRARCCGRKGMAAPVHRFAAVDCPPRRPPRQARPNTAPAPAPQPSASVRRNEAVYVDMETPPTIASLAAARSVTPDTLLRTAALGLHHSPMMAPHLKFGMLVSFALATLFLAGAKYYFDRQSFHTGRDGGASTEAGLVCSAVAGVCGLTCVLSLCRRHSTPRAQPDRVSSTAARPPPPPQSEQSDDISLATLLAPERSSSSSMSGPGASLGLGLGPGAALSPGSGPGGDEAPPPYNIAVLMPRQSPPPPAYSAIS